MTNPNNVIKVLSDLILNKSIVHSSSAITSGEEHIALNLYKCLDSIMESTAYLFETETTLDHDDEIDVQDLEDAVSITSTFEDLNGSKDDNYEPANDHDLRNHFSLEYMKRAVHFYDEMDPITGKRKRKWRTLQHNFRRIPDPTYIARFRKYIEVGGTKEQKLRMVDTYVYDQFENARHKFLSVHDIDLRRWSFEKARELNLNDFEASIHWLSNFKYHHGICSRKITKLVTKKDVENKQQINEAAKNFILEINEVIEKYHPNQIINSDQMGIELEPHGNRTLTTLKKKELCRTLRKGSVDFQKS